MATTGSKIEDLTGQKFGRLLVKARAPNKIYPSGQQATMWICMGGTSKMLYHENYNKGENHNGKKLFSGT